jgi:hypothetical protein
MLDVYILLWAMTTGIVTMIINKVLLVFDYFWHLVGLFDPIGCFN